MPRIFVTSRLPPSALSILRDVGEVDVPETPLGADALRGQVAGHEALVTLLTDRVDAALLDAAAPALKVVANIAVGFDNIDVAAAAARKVIVTNTPDVLTDAVAELTWGLILAVTRRIGEGDRLIRSGGWKGWTPDLLPGMELRGKQLGIIGAGRIGRAVARRAVAFGVNVLFAAHGSRPAGDGLRTTSLDELLVSSDIVSVHVPLTPASRHLIDRRTLLRMRRTAYLVNTSRGPVVDEDALAWALGERLIAGAALDVFEREPQVTPALLALDNVILTPHVGSATRETRLAMAELAARNVAAVLSGRAPLTPVTVP